MQRNSAIDIAKGIAIFLVIIGHQYDLPEISHFIYSFHMPLFFILGGYFFHKKKIKTDVLSNVRRLIFPYFFVGIVYLMWYFVFGLKYHSMDIPQRAVKALFFGSGAYHGNVIWSQFPTIGMIWFLLALYWCKITYNIIVNCVPTYKFLISLSISIIAVLIDNYVINIPLSILPGLSAVIFYAIGDMFNEYKEGIIKHNIILLSTGMVCWIFALMYSSTSMVNCQYGFYPLDIVAGCMGTYVLYYFSSLIARKKNIITSFFMWSGINSMTILCAHFLEQSTFVWQHLHIPEKWYIILPIKFVYVIMFIAVAYKISLVRKVLMVSKFER